MVQTKFRQKVEIRQDSTDVESDKADEISGVNVLTDSLHPNDLRRFGGVRLYIVNTHNVDLEVEVEHTNTEDMGFEEAVTATTFEFVSGGGPPGSRKPSRTFRFNTPVGRLRYFVSAPASAPNDGFLMFEAITTRGGI